MLDSAPPETVQVFDRRSFLLFRTACEKRAAFAPNIVLCCIVCIIVWIVWIVWIGRWNLEDSVRVYYNVYSITASLI